MRTIDIIWFFDSNIGSAGIVAYTIAQEHLRSDAFPGTTSIRLELNSPAPHPLHHDRFLLFSLQHGSHN